MRTGLLLQCVLSVAYTKYSQCGEYAFVKSMDQSFNTSFIPKKQTHGGFVTQGQENGSPVVQRRNGGPLGLFFFLSAITFFLTILGTVGMFVYIKVVERSIEKKVAEATELKDEFNADVETVLELRRLSVRLEEASKLLIGHRALSGLIAQLEESTLKDVRYVSLAFSETEGVEGEHSLSLSGEARSFGHVAKQIDKFVEMQSLLRTPVVSSLESGNGMVKFVTEMGVVPSSIRFGSAIESGMYTRKRSMVEESPAASETSRSILTSSSTSATSSTAVDDSE